MSKHRSYINTNKAVNNVLVENRKKSENGATNCSTSDHDAAVDVAGAGEVSSEESSSC